ncbi:hypothetical protein VTN77DRAFT_9766 [Rasamsonia byssochlamydoides]|uniref:uncharacterized protein n=1 Tax=Rasamsonia byssochlamydoides TaxID=89139 RepID=UPI0037431463
MSSIAPNHPTTPAPPQNRNDTEFPARLARQEKNTRLVEGQQETGVIAVEGVPIPSKPLSSSPGHEANEYVQTPPLMRDNAITQQQQQQHQAGTTQTVASNETKPQILRPGQRHRIEDDLVVPLTSLRQTSMPVDCPVCQRRVTTTVRKTIGESAQIWAMALCCLGGILCAWIPCVMDECKDHQHYCSECNRLLATATVSGAVTVNIVDQPIRSQYVSPPQPVAAPQDNTAELDTKTTEIFEAAAPVSELGGKDIPPPGQVRDLGVPAQEMAAETVGRVEEKENLRLERQDGQVDKKTDKG